MGQQRYLSGRMVEFTENPLTRFDEEVKLARAYDQWVSSEPFYPRYSIRRID
jgi:hypothetical protein